MSRGGFRRGPALALVVVCAVSLLGLALLLVFGPDFQPTHSGDPNVYSLSAVGHAALMDLLDARGVPTAIHRDPGRAPVTGHGVLALLEPDPSLCSERDGRRAVRSLVEASPAVFLALSKWEAQLDGGTDPRATGVAPLAARDVLAPLRALGIGARLARVQQPVEPATTHASGSPSPTFTHVYRQLLVAPTLEPLVGGPDGILLGRARWHGVPLLILADPDVLENHGLWHDPNAGLVLGWLDGLRDGGPVVFDETLHGFPPPNRSIVREMFRFPLVIVLLHAALLLGLVLWAGLGRFGEVRRPAQALEAGSGFLIRHTASLLRFGGHRDMALRRYVGDVRRDVAGRMRLGTARRGEALDAHLDALGRRRGTRASWSEVKARALRAAARTGRGASAEVLRAARELHAWKREILDGTRDDSRDPRPVA